MGEQISQKERLLRLLIALQRLVAKAKGVEVCYDTEDQIRAADHLDVAIELAEQEIEAASVKKDNNGSSISPDA